MAVDTERAQVAHLLRRAGFGATEAELDEYAALGFASTVERLLNYEQVDDSAVEERLASLQLDLRNGEQAKYAWLVRMLYTRRPLQEKMTLFWHTHFATALSKVRNPQLMLQQIQLFRDDALGNFEQLLQRVTRDPAMLNWLDNRQNRKGAPNENYAREVMELFTVGIGAYTDADVKAAARAFTGYTLARDGQFTFDAKQHDDGDKTFLGETRNWDADDVLATLVRHPATARFLTSKLFRYFVYDNPSEGTIERLAGTFRSSGFDMRAVVRDILTGPEFLSPAAVRGQVKQPVELVIGVLKTLNVQAVGPDLPQVTRRMGQDLLNPPDVSGWKGGDGWISATTLLERFNFADRLLSSRAADQPYFVDVSGQLRGRNTSSPTDVVDYYLALLVDGDATPDARRALVDYLGGHVAEEKVRGMLHVALSLPTYQLA
ncbi:MAG TPA: DUF1800 domain-containing protein [Chloroflexota bacterium]|nr:DUF1800 domain-containing protein [Chloroflexota bacterium]